jgi:DNA modification methylase
VSAEWTVVNENCIDAMKRMGEASVHAIICDPPYGLSFMGKEWDRYTALEFEEWCESWATEALRVLVPGGHLAAFGGTRTFHRCAAGIEDAGFEIRDTLSWLYGSGFPKSMNLSGDHDGWGTALKPAWEPIILARKPFKGTVAATMDAHGTGAINIAATRLSWGEGGDLSAARKEAGYSEAAKKALGKTVASESETGFSGEVVGTDSSEGRWPANVVLSHLDGCRQVGTASEEVGGGAHATSGFVEGYEKGDGFEGRSVESPVWECEPDCPVRLLDEQSGPTGARGPASGPTYSGEHKSGSMAGRFLGMGDKPAVFHGDEGGASRFFYCAKANTAERQAGLGSNDHPTVKPIDLMRWLCKLLAPKDGIILDPFLGSGTTGCAAVVEGFRFIGIEKEAEYVPIATARIEFWADLPKGIETEKAVEGGKKRDAIAATGQESLL